MTAGRPRLFRLDTRLTPARFAGIAALVFLGLLLLWAAVTLTGLVRPLFLPSPVQVANRLWLLAQSGQLWDDAAISIYRILVGFLLATVVAVPIGVLIGRYHVWEALVEPVVDFVRYMPVVAFVPLTILWTGTGDTQKFLIIFIGQCYDRELLPIADLIHDAGGWPAPLTIIAVAATFYWAATRATAPRSGRSSRRAR